MTREYRSRYSGTPDSFDFYHSGRDIASVQYPCSCVGNRRRLGAVHAGVRVYRQCNVMRGHA